ncbi:MAG: DNA polymerase III subunit beta [Lactobacillales bacterium]|jgi:DNA polymerase-3 subunit beta|nr:DNA polymerase III subunit beta [Lactobacillales bacterium]
MFQVTLNHSYFLASLRTTLKAVANKTTIPVLTGIKIEVSAHGIQLTGSNADISIETFISLEDKKAEIQIIEHGAIILEGKIFANIVSNLPEKLFTMEVMENKQVRITSGKAEFFVNGIDAENYPILPSVENKNSIKLPIELITQLIEETAFAVSTQESRPILTGIHLSLTDNKKLTAVATDSHRLSRQACFLTTMVEDFEITVSGKNLKELSSIFVEEENIEVHINKNQIAFESSGIRYYSRLLEGNYPETSRLIPSEFNTEVIFKSCELLHAVERASLLSQEGKNNVVRLEITAEQVKIFGNSPEIGKVEEELEFISVDGDSLTISFNPDYMKAALKAFGDGEIKLQFVSPVRPFTLKRASVEDDFVQLVTPVRTN